MQIFQLVILFKNFKIIHIMGGIKAKVRAIVNILYLMQVVHKWWVPSWVKIPRRHDLTK